jgi:hypothetical protein
VSHVHVCSCLLLCLTPFQSLQVDHVNG